METEFETLPEITAEEEAAMKATGTTSAAETAPETAVAPPEVKVEAPAAEAKPEEPKEPKTVPLSALQEEREERKRLRDQLAKQEERFQQLIQRLAPQQPQAPAQKPLEERVNENPLAIVAETARRQEQWEEQQRTQAQQHAELQQIAALTTAHVQQFVQTAPDYHEAINFLKDGRARELAHFGLNPLQIQQQIALEEVQIARDSLRLGKNPAEVAYQLAQGRGYASKAAAKAQAQPVDPALQAMQRTAEAVETLAKGAAASKSLGTAGGAPGEGTLTLKAITDMSDEEFSRLSDRDFKKAMKQFYSGAA